MTANTARWARTTTVDSDGTVHNRFGGQFATKDTAPASGGFDTLISGFPTSSLEDALSAQSPREAAEMAARFAPDGVYEQQGFVTPDSELVCEGCAEEAGGTDDLTPMTGYGQNFETDALPTCSTCSINNRITPLDHTLTNDGLDYLDEQLSGGAATGDIANFHGYSLDKHEDDLRMRREERRVQDGYVARELESYTVQDIPLSELTPGDTFFVPQDPNVALRDPEEALEDLSFDLVGVSLSDGRRIGHAVSTYGGGENSAISIDLDGPARGVTVPVSAHSSLMD